MAAFNFPSNPTDGQLYPDPAVPGQQQYIYSSAKSTWQTISNAVGRVYGVTPVVIKGTTQAPIVTVNQASSTQAGYISSTDYGKIQSIPPEIGTVTEIVAGAGLNVTAALGDDLPTAGAITTTGTLNITPATRTAIGGVKVGAGLSILPDGTLSAGAGTIPYFVLDNIGGQFNDFTTSFDLTDGGVQVFPSELEAIWIFLGGVFQMPGLAFTFVNGQSTITFTEAPRIGTTFYGVVFS
jgi:hypothetical protein